MDVEDRLEDLFPTPTPPKHTQTEQREGKGESESHPDLEMEATMSALASIQIIEDLNAVQYTDDIKTPKPDLTFVVIQEQTKEEEEEGGIQGGDPYRYIPDTDPDDIHTPIVIPPPPYEHIWNDIYSANIAAYRLHTALLDSKRADNVLAITKAYPQAISARFTLQERLLLTTPELTRTGSPGPGFPTTALSAAHVNLKQAFLLYSEQFDARKEYFGRALVRGSEFATPNSWYGHEEAKSGSYGYPEPGDSRRSGVARQDSGPEDEGLLNEDSLLCLVEDVDGACDALGEHTDLCRMLRLQVKGLLKFLIQNEEMDWPPPPGSVPSLGEAVIRTILVQLSQIAPTDSSARIADAIGQMSANLVEFARSQDFEIYVGISPSPIDLFPPLDRNINISYSPPPTPPMYVNLNANGGYSNDGSERAHSHPNPTFNQPAVPAFPTDAPPKTYTPPIPRPSNPAPVLSPTSTALDSSAFYPTKMYVNPNRLAEVAGSHSPYSGEGDVAHSVLVANFAPGSSNLAAAVMRKTNPSEVLDDPNGLDGVVGRGFEAVDSFMQALRQDVAAGHPDSQRFREALIYLWELTGHYPAEQDITNEVSRMSRTAIVQDAISFTHHAVWLGIQPVLVRYLKTSEPPSRIRRRLRRDIDIWRKLFHPNIHPFCGVVLPRHGAFGWVMPHVQSGDVIQFLLDHPNSDRTRFVLEAAEGLRYLHDEAKLVHGDFRGVNLLVSDSGRILVTGYGVMTAIEKNQELGFPEWSIQWGDARWMAPELHRHVNPTTGFPGVRTLQSDVYAFGCTALEIWTGMAPFAGQRDTNVVLEVSTKGQHPPRPAVPLISKSRTDQVWALLQACWDLNPAVRPSIRSILENLWVLAE